VFPILSSIPKPIIPLKKPDLVTPVAPAFGSVAPATRLVAAALGSAAPAL